MFVPILRTDYRIRLFHAAERAKNRLEDGENPDIVLQLLVVSMEEILADMTRPTVTRIDVPKTSQ